MTNVRNALIIGGGIAGMSAALALKLKQPDIIVDLIDSDPNWRAAGAGLTITGATLRAFRELGVFDEIRQQGFFSEGLRMFTREGQLLRQLDRPPLGDDIPRNGGIMRPVLHAIMSRKVRASGANVRLGVSVAAMDQDGAGVDVRFSDGTRDRYDLVLAADGAFSSTRALLFADAPKPRYTGQGCWRVVGPRPEDMTYGEFYLGPAKAGITPCSSTEVYMFLLDHSVEKRWIEEEELVPLIKHDLAEFGGRIAELREGIGPQSSVMYRPLEILLMPLPWHKGRIGLLGDAVHATTPHLASGAGIAVEDALVLAEEMLEAQSVERALDAYGRRRYDRCRIVVENSVRLGAMELAGVTGPDYGALIEASMAELANPI